jgi:Flp pilus assembly protein TadD
MARGGACALLLGLHLVLLGCTTLEGYRHFQAGTLALDRGDAGAAVTELERAAAILPERSEVFNHLGLAYAAAGRRTDALFAFERAVALDCDNRAAAENLHALEAASAVAH